MKEMQIRTISEFENLGMVSLQTGPFGTQLKASEYVSIGIPVINVRNIGYGEVKNKNLEYIDEQKADKLKQHTLRRGDIVFGRKGAVDRHAFIDESNEGWIQGSDCLRLRINSSKICAKYLSYYFKTQTHKDWMQALCSFGATMNSLNQEIVRKISFPVPPIEVQQKIAAVLSAYDDLIENNKRRINLLEKMAEEIYREWFVRFRFPGHEEVKFDKKVPENWKYTTVDQIVTFQSGYSFKSKRYLYEGNFGIITIKNVHDGIFISKCEDYINELPSNMHSHCLLYEGEILMSLTGNVGRVCRVYGNNYLLNQRVAKLKPKIEHSSSFIYWFFRQKNIQVLSEYISTGVAQQNLSPIKLGNQKILIPPIALMQLFEKKVDPIDKLMVHLHKSNKILYYKRNILIPRLISGKISVEDLDIQFPPSMQDKFQHQAEGSAYA